MSNKTAEELESEIYDSFYNEHPDGDARTNGLWKAVIDCRGKCEELQKVLDDVNEDYYL